MGSGCAPARALEGCGFGGPNRNRRPRTRRTSSLDRQPRVAHRPRAFATSPVAAPASELSLPVSALSNFTASISSAIAS